VTAVDDVRSAREHLAWLREHHGSVPTVADVVGAFEQVLYGLFRLGQFAESYRVLAELSDHATAVELDEAIEVTSVCRTVAAVMAARAEAHVVSGQERIRAGLIELVEGATELHETESVVYRLLADRAADGQI